LIRIAKWGGKSVNLLHKSALRPNLPYPPNNLTPEQSFYSAFPSPVKVHPSIYTSLSQVWANKSQWKHVSGLFSVQTEHYPGHLTKLKVKSLNAHDSFKASSSKLDVKIILTVGLLWGTIISTL
jgi:hypothetical protein